MNRVRTIAATVLMAVTLTACYLGWKADKNARYWRDRAVTCWQQE